jgi:hypothetical protein
MTLTAEYPLPPKPANPAYNPQNNLTVQSPAASPSGALVSQIVLEGLTADQPAMIAPECAAGDYLVILSLSVSGNPPASNRVPGLQVSFSSTSFNGGSEPLVLQGTTSQGSDIVAGWSTSQSLALTHNGLGAVICAGTFGGRYTANSDWSYSVTLSIYKTA